MANLRKNRITFSRAPQKNQRFYILESNTGWTLTAAVSAASTNIVEHLNLAGNVKYNYNIKTYNSYNTLSQEENHSQVTIPRQPVINVGSLVFDDNYNGTVWTVHADPEYKNLKVTPNSGDGSEEALSLDLWTHKDGESSRIWETTASFTDKNEKSYTVKLSPGASNKIKGTLSNSSGTSEESNVTVNAGYWLRRADYYYYSNPSNRGWMDKSSEGTPPSDEAIADFQMYFFKAGVSSTVQVVAGAESVAYFANGWKKQSNFNDSLGNSLNRYYKVNNIAPSWNDRGGGSGRVTYTYNLGPGETLGFHNSGGGRSLQVAEGGQWFDFSTDSGYYKEAIILSTDPNARIALESPSEGNGNRAKLRFEGSSWKMFIGKGNAATPESGYVSPSMETIVTNLNLAGPTELVIYLKCVKSSGTDFFWVYASCSDSSRLPQGVPGS